MASIEEELARLKLQNSQLEDEVQRMRKEGCETPKEINDYLKARTAFQLDDVDSPDSPHVISASREGASGGQWIKPLGVRPAAPSMAESTLNEMEAAISSLRAWREQRQQEMNSLQRQNEAFLEELYAQPPDEVEEEEDLHTSGRDEDSDDAPADGSSPGPSEEQRVLDELESLAKQWRTSMATNATSSSGPGGSLSTSHGQGTHAGGPSNFLSQRVMDLLKQAERMTFVPPSGGGGKSGKGSMNGVRVAASPAERPASLGRSRSAGLGANPGQPREGARDSRPAVPSATSGGGGVDSEDDDGAPAAVMPGKTDWSAYMRELEKQQAVEDSDEFINWSSDLNSCLAKFDILSDK